MSHKETEESKTAQQDRGGSPNKNVSFDAIKSKETFDHLG